MTKIEIATFIERMEEIGDIWEEADVERVYGDPDAGRCTEELVKKSL